MDLNSVDSRWISFQMVIAETPKAYMLCIDADSDASIWLAKSQIKGVTDMNSTFFNDVSDLDCGGKVLVSKWMFDKLQQALSLQKAQASEEM